MALRILVTGGAGFIGSSLVKALVNNPDYKVVVVDDLSTGSKDKLGDEVLSKIEFIHCNVNSTKEVASVFHAFRFDYVFHYAAMVGVERTLEHPVKVLEDINGIKNVLNLSKNTGVKHIYYASSSEVYGEPVEFPQNEHTTPLNSRLPYAIVKNVGEAYLKAYKKEFDLDYTIFRFFNTYGTMQSDDFVISKFLLAARSNQDIPVNGDGTQTRTFCHISDNIAATMKIFEERLLVNDIINLGSGVEISIMELAQTIIRMTGSSSKIINLPPLEEGDMKRRHPDNSKMIGILDRELLSLEEGLRKML